MSEKIRILIADDHAILREGLRALIATKPGLELVAEAADGVEVVDILTIGKPAHSPDLPRETLVNSRCHAYT